MGYRKSSKELGCIRIIADSEKNDVLFRFRDEAPETRVQLNIFTEDEPAPPTVLVSEPTTSDVFIAGLDPESSAFMQMLASKLIWAREELEKLADDHNLMLDGTLDSINDASFERIVNHYSFYTAFATPEEYWLVSGDRTLGTLPIDRPVAVDSLLIFGGRRWLVVEVDSAKKVIVLKPSKGGVPPVFGGQAGWIHDRIRQEMFEVYGKKRPGLSRRPSEGAFGRGKREL